jgi:predicted CXXCH cytochrome family protein
MIAMLVKLRWRILLGAGLLLLVGWIAWRGLRPDNLSRPPEDPRLTFTTPYRNVRPEVKYVGSDKCAACHPDEAAAYRQHPMGRSLVPVAQADVLERFGPESHNPFETSGFQFLVVRQDGKLLHKEIRPDPHSQAKTEFAAEIQYALGSGTRARAYLIDREGYLFESAITWFSQKGRWDLSPGFAANPHSDRPVTVECLFCHCNQADAMDQTVNRYRMPIFHGLEIGCERCHGPGELHVQRRQNNDPVSDEDDSIVNPGRLEPALREAVCRQCHLQGKMRILHAGRKPFDFRPGLPWQLFWSVFVEPPDASNTRQAVGQVEQMVASRCYGGGKMGCISCHDPHSVPEPAARVAYYRGRCLTCHTETSCTRPVAAPPGHNQKVDCIGCHMPRRLSSDVAHTAITDHRILRRHGEAGQGGEAGTPAYPAEPQPQRLGRSLALPRDYSLSTFPPDRFNLQDREFSRDFGLALTRLAESATVDRPARVKLTQNALPLLDAAVKTYPQDVPAWQARGYALWQLNQKQEARASFETALKLWPEQEAALTSAASLAAEMGEHAGAIIFWQRALAVNPWTARSHFELARLYVLRQEWQKAADEAKTVLPLNPFHFEARKLLIVCYQQMGNQAQARAEFARLLELNPPGPESLHHWFDQQSR